MTASNLGAVRFLNKPLQREALVQTVEQVLSRQRVGERPFGDD